MAYLQLDTARYVTCNILIRMIIVKGVPCPGWVTQSPAFGKDACTAVFSYTYLDKIFAVYKFFPYPISLYPYMYSRGVGIRYI